MRVTGTGQGSEHVYDTDPVTPEKDAHLLRFSHESEDTGGSKYPNEEHIRAFHPDHGQVGHVQFLRGNRVNSPILIKMLKVNKDHQRKGYGSALMDQLQQRYPKSRIDHGDRTDDGKGWWASYGQGKADRRGRTAELETPAPTVHKVADRYNRHEDDWTYNTSIKGQLKVTSPDGEEKIHHSFALPNGLTHLRHPHHVPTPMYHGTSRDITGDQIEPGHPGNFVKRMKHVYMTDDLDQARHYAGPSGHVYQVRPTDWYGHRSDAKGSAWASEGPLDIVDKVPHGRTATLAVPTPAVSVRVAGAGMPLHADVISTAQNMMRSHLPGVCEQLPHPRAASRKLQDLLGQLGHPRADEAFVIRHPNPDARKSQVVFDSDTGAPGVALHEDRWDIGTLAHEAAHHMDLHTSGLDPLVNHSDEVKHGQSFADHYQRALEVVHPEAAKFFGTVHPRVLRRWKLEAEKKNAPKQAKTAKTGVQISYDHHDEYPETWSESYRSWAREKPHAAAVSQAQEKARFEAPNMSMALGSREDATESMRHMMRQGGHPQAEDSYVMKHRNPEWGQSQAFVSEGEPCVALHQDRWDYGTLAHEVAHHLRDHEAGGKPANDEEAHGPDFIRHYQRVLGEFGHGAAETLGQTYGEALDRIHRHAGDPS